MSYQQAAAYRRRAAHLHSLATRLCTTPAMRLHLHAGVDTWHGPLADACASDLLRAQQAVHRAVDELRTQAFTFDRRADELGVTAAQVERQLEIEGRQ